MSNVIMDASAILAFLNQESGSEQITDLIENATIGTVNLSKVIAKLAEIGIPEPEILQILSDLNLGHWIVKVGRLLKGLLYKGFSQLKTSYPTLRDQCRLEKIKSHS